MLELGYEEVRSKLCCMRHGRLYIVDIPTGYNAAVVTFKEGRVYVIYTFLQYPSEADLALVTWTHTPLMFLISKPMGHSTKDKTQSYSTGKYEI